MSVFNPLICEKCGGELESDDAISIIEGRCARCRQAGESLSQPLRADQMMSESAEREGRVSLREPTPYQASPLQADLPAPDAPVSERSPLPDHPPSIPADGDIPATAQGPASGPVIEPNVWPNEPPPSQSLRPQAAGHVAAEHETPPTSVSMPARTLRPQPRPGELHPPIPPFASEPRSTPKFRRRRRDLSVGIVFGLILTVVMAGYLISGRSQRDRLAVTQDARKVQLALRLSPVSAVVKLDGKEIGTPAADGRLKVSVPASDPSDHWLEVSAEGYSPIRQPLSMYQGAPEAFIELVPKPYELVVTTDPPQAEVLLNGRRKGTSPLTLKVDPSREATLEVRRPGFLTMTKTLKPPAQGNRVALDLEMVEAGPVLSVVSEPAGAAVSVDGKTLGTTPLKFQLSRAYLGKTVKIVASARGYEDASLKMEMPAKSGGDPVDARLILARPKARLMVQTDPPGGRVVVAGRDYGNAPVAVEFDRSQTGKRVTMEASRDGSLFGREVVTVPPPGRPVPFTLPLTFSAQRVVFILGWPMPPSDGGDPLARQAAQAERFAWADRITSQIHGLRNTQRFAIVAATDNGVASWPGPEEMETGSTEQKVRAYDIVRMVRPTGKLDLDELLQASLAYRPTTIWLFVPGELDLVALEQFGNRPESQHIGLNVVRPRDDADAAWLQTWTAQHHGMVTFLNLRTPAAVAMDKRPS